MKVTPVKNLTTISPKVFPKSDKCTGFPAYAGMPLYLYMKKGCFSVKQAEPITYDELQLLQEKNQEVWLPW